MKSVGEMFFNLSYNIWEVRIVSLVLIVIFVLNKGIEGFVVRFFCFKDDYYVCL